jgi:DNA topoisomerase-1
MAKTSLSASRLPNSLRQPVHLEAARAVGLRYVNDQLEGFTRLRRGKSFIYQDAKGRPVRSPQRLQRIRALVIPPAWTEVWICSSAEGHIQAVGRDARGRKQYLYHPRFREVREETKFDRMLAFGAALPKIRARCERDLATRGLSKNKVLAAVVSVLDRTAIRVGNDEYARFNQSFGLTTLQDRHAKIQGARVRFLFRGKGGKERDVCFADPRLARVIKRCQDVPGERLFQYQDEDEGRHAIDSCDVNRYLREASGADFTAKDFRTWNATVIAAVVLSQLGPCATVTATKRAIAQAVKQTAGHLGNTPTICRRSYIHPAVLDGYTRGEVLRRLALISDASFNGASKDRRQALREEEKAVMVFLKRAQKASKALGVTRRAKQVS